MPQLLEGLLVLLRQLPLFQLKIIKLFNKKVAPGKNNHKNAKKKNNLFYVAMQLCSYKDLLSWVARRCAPRRWHTRGRRGADLFIAFAARNAVTFLVVAKSSSLAQSQCNLPSHTGSALRVTKTLTEILMWSACHKKSYLTNLEVRNLKSEISCLCPVWLSQFCLF